MPPQSASQLYCRLPCFHEKSLPHPLFSAGTQQVVGLEYQHIRSLDPFLPAGTKVLVYDATVRRGMLLLTPSSLVVLGGQVERLEQARLKMVEDWNQPAGGWCSAGQTHTACPSEGGSTCIVNVRLRL